MIVLDLECRSGGHGFEGWFASRAAFEVQDQAGDLMCPVCGSGDIMRKVSAARLARKANQLSSSSGARSSEKQVAPAVSRAADGPKDQGVGMQALISRLAEFQARTLPKSQWVGGRFADTVRQMAAGDEPQALIHGQATPDEARALVDDGLPVLPLLVPFVPPDERH